MKVVAQRLAEDRLLHLTLDHPKGNVLTLEVMGELRAALAFAKHDPHLRCVMVQGAGGHFSFGASVEEHRREHAPAMLRGFHALIREIAEYPVPVAALVEGRCLGGAFELILAAHFVLASPTARMGCPEIKLGVFPPVLAALGPLRLGMALTERLMLTGDTITSETLSSVGALAATLPDEEPLAGALAWYGQTLGPLSAHALRQTARAARRHPLWQQSLGAALDAVEAQYLAEVVTSHDGNEGIEAFIERRPPAWRDA